jgi:hypothetical protein
LQHELQQPSGFRTFLVFALCFGQQEQHYEKVTVKSNPRNPHPYIPVLTRVSGPLDGAKFGEFRAIREILVNIFLKNFEIGGCFGPPDRPKALYPHGSRAF